MYYRSRVGQFVLRTRTRATAKRAPGRGGVAVIMHCGRHRRPSLGTVPFDKRPQNREPWHICRPPKTNYKASSTFPMFRNNPAPCETKRHEWLSADCSAALFDNVSTCCQLPGTCSPFQTTECIRTPGLTICHLACGAGERLTHEHRNQRQHVCESVSDASNTLDIPKQDSCAMCLRCQNGVRVSRNKLTSCSLPSGDVDSSVRGSLRHAGRPNGTRAWLVCAQTSSVEFHFKLRLKCVKWPSRGTSISPLQLVEQEMIRYNLLLVRIRVPR